MRNLSFDDGFISLTINNDPNRVISFNPADMGILERISKSIDVIEKVTNDNQDIKLKNDGTPLEELANIAETVNKVDKTIKEQINYIFNSNISDAVFGNQSALSLCKGVPLWESFLLTIIPVIEEEVMKEKKKSAERIKKYTKQVVK